VTRIPPPALRSTPRSRLLYEVLARHSDAPVVRAARRVAEASVTVLHSENTDPRTNGEYEVLRRLGRETLGVVFDVGANQGNWSREVLRLNPRATVYCAEISEPTRERLRASVPGVVVLDHGLLDRDGIVRVKHYPDDDRLSSVYDYPHPLRAVWREEPVVTGDRVAAAHGVERIDMVKVDVEGADLAVLHGFRASLEAGRISVVQFEYGYASVLARTFLLDFFELLEPNGYTIAEVHRGGVEPLRYRLERENFFGPNFVAVHDSAPALLDRLVARTRGRSAGGRRTR
jgi:FkbM family methyltransferase